MITGAWDASLHHFLNRGNNLNKKLSFPVQCIALNFFLSVSEHLVYRVVLCLNANSQVSSLQ